ncbi:MAG: hypothetical protein WBV69_09250 [Candidatus Sulfotelmatobacter sp.]
MVDGESFQLLPSSRRKLQKDIPAVRPSILAPDQARGFASIGELDNGVVAQTKTLSHIADRRSHLVGGSSDLKEELMLLWLETALLCRYLTEVKKQADLVAKFGEYLKFVC